MKTHINFILLFLFLSTVVNAQSTAGPWQTNDVIDERIDVHAQRSLMRLMKGNAIEQKVATDLLTAVKAGYLEGIYLVDQGVPAKRVRANGGNWWETVPKGELYALVTEPTSRAPLIALPKNILADHAKTDLALIGAWMKMIILEQDEVVASRRYGLVATHSTALGVKKQGYVSTKSMAPSSGFPYTPDQLLEAVNAAAGSMKWTDGQRKWVTLYYMNHAIELSRAVGDEVALRTYETAIESFAGKDALIKCIRYHVERPLGEQTAVRQKIFRKIDFLFAKGKEEREKMYVPTLNKVMTRPGLIAGDPVFDDNTVVGKIAKDAKGTTCIEFQRKLLVHHVTDAGREGFRLVKTANINSRPSFFQPEDIPRAKQANAWRSAKQNMAQTYRPKPGDIYLLNYPKDVKLIKPIKHRNRPGWRSHTGYIKSIKVISPEKEIWTTVDGGQNVSGLQAVLEVKRIYNPTTNMLYAEQSASQAEGTSSQDQYLRFLFGWVDVDYIIE